MTEKNKKIDIETYKSPLTDEEKKEYIADMETRRYDLCDIDKFTDCFGVNDLRLSLTYKFHPRYCKKTSMRSIGLVLRSLKRFLDAGELPKKLKDLKICLALECSSLAVCDHMKLAGYDSFQGDELKYRIVGNVTRDQKIKFIRALHGAIQAHSK